MHHSLCNYSCNCKFIKPHFKKAPTQNHNQTEIAFKHLWKKEAKTCHKFMPRVAKQNIQKNQPITAKLWNLTISLVREHNQDTLSSTAKKSDTMHGMVQDAKHSKRWSKKVYRMLCYFTCGTWICKTKCMHESEFTLCTGESFTSQQYWRP